MVSIRTHTSRWSYCRFEQLLHHFRVRCAFRDLSKQGRYDPCEGLPYILARQGLPLYSVGTLRPARLCRSLLVFQDVSCRLPGGDRSTVLHPHSTRKSNTDWSKPNQPMQKSVSGLWPSVSLHQVYLCTTLCWKFVIDSTLFQHSCNRSLPLYVGQLVLFLICLLKSLKLSQFR